MTDYSPEISHFRLVIQDDEAGELYVTFKVPLNEPQVEGIDAAANMTASALEVDAIGYRLTLIHGLLRIVPNGWRKWWGSADIATCDGFRALAAFRAFDIWGAAQTRNRGERGPSLAGLERRDFLISAVLLRIARGMSQRGAVENTLDEYEPESTARESAALLQAVKRHMRGLPAAA